MRVTQAEGCHMSLGGSEPNGKIQDRVKLLKNHVPGTIISRDQVEENYFCTESTVKGFDPN
jgi:hypothetical protein